MYEIEQVREATTPSEMRVEIARLTRNNHIVRATMDCADYTGLSAEDRYTMLAYHALAVLAKTQRVMHEYVLTTPGPHLVLPNVRAEAGPTAKRQARAVENAPAHCAGLAF